MPAARCSHSEQVIEVPKISSPSRHCRRRVRFAEKTAEQLVEVPTIISYSSLLQRTASSSSSREHAGEGVFRTFPRVKLGSHSGSELSADFNPSTLSAHQMAPPDERTSMVDDNGHAWVRLDTARGSLWQNLDTGHQQWRPPWEH